MFLFLRILFAHFIADFPFQTGKVYILKAGGGLGKWAHTLIIFLISVIFVFVAISNVGDISPFSMFLYCLFVLNALIIALAFHIIIVAVGILTTEIDSALWLYRDFTQMGRIPVDLYQEPVRAILTFVIPVAIMTTVPAKILLGMLSWQIFPAIFAFSLAFLFASLKFWKFSLKNYTSVSY